MRKILSGAFICLVIALTGCQSATPLSRVLIIENVEFILAPGQEATLASTGLVVTLLGVTSDERCPSEVECAASGPVSISLSVRVGNGESNEIQLQTFTDYEGRAPSMQFEGIENSVIHEGYIFRIMGVLPYPASPSKPIESSDYQVALIVTQQ